MQKKNMICCWIVLTLTVHACSQKEKKVTTVDAPKVKTMEVTVGNEQNELVYSGTIEEESATYLSFSTAGTICQIMVSEGQSIGRGKLIATVDSSNMINGAQASHAATEQADDLVQQAQASLDQAQDAYDRMKILYDNGSLPEIKWIEMETKLEQAKLMLSQAQSNAKAARSTENIAKKSVDDTRLFSPASGYISEKLCNVGQNILPGTPVVKLVRIDRVKVSVSVPEKEISHIRNGQSVAVNIAALGNRRFVGKVVEIGVIAAPLSRSYMVKAVIDNPGHILLPGMIAEVAIESGNNEYGRALSVLPSPVIQLDADNKTYVWKVVDGKATKCFIEVGQNTSDGIQIAHGLEIGDTVICEGMQKVYEGCKINGIEQL